MTTKTSDFVKYGETFLSFTRKPSYEEIEQVMKFILFEEDNLSWHLGDLLNAAEDYLGETYAQLVPEKLAKKAQKRKRVCKVYNRFNQRFSSLSFSHHEEVVSVKDVIMRQELLGLADDNQWTVGQLREEKNRRLGKLPKVKTVECPGCKLVFDPRESKGE